MVLLSPPLPHLFLSPVIVAPVILGHPLGMVPIRIFVVFAALEYNPARVPVITVWRHESRGNKLEFPGLFHSNTRSCCCCSYSSVVLAHYYQAGWLIDIGSTQFGRACCQTWCFHEWEINRSSSEEDVGRCREGGAASEWGRKLFPWDRG